MLNAAESMVNQFGHEIRDIVGRDKVAAARRQHATEMGANAEENKPPLTEETPCITGTAERPKTETR